MSKMAEMAQTIEELRTAAASINAAADWLYQQFSGDNNEAQTTEAPAKKEQSEVDSHHREEAMNRIKELQKFIAGQETDISEFDEALVKKLIEKITVFDEHFSVEFKSGISINIEA
jgi:chromosome segregation ATPase